MSDVVKRSLRPANGCGSRMTRDWKSLRQGLRVVAATAGTTILLVYLADAASFELAIAARPMSQHGVTVQQVDRSHKADKLSIAVSSTPRPKPVQPAVPSGCEPVFSPLVFSESPRLSVRCTL